MLNLLVSDVPIYLSQGLSCDMLYMRDCLPFTDDAKYKPAKLSVATTVSLATVCCVMIMPVYRNHLFAIARR